MATLEELAPNIAALGITRSQIENKFSSIPVKEDPPPPAEPSPAKVNVIADAVLIDGLKAHGGLLGLCHEVGLTREKVKVFIREVQALKAEYDRLESLEEPVVKSTIIK